MKLDKSFINLLNTTALYLNKISKVLLLIMMVLMSISVILQVSLRYFGLGFKYGDEIARVMLVGVVYFGASVCVYEKRHAKLSLLIDRLSGKLEVYFSIFSRLIILFALICFVKSGFDYLKVAPTLKSAVMGIPMFWPKLIIVISGTMLIFNYLVEIINNINKLLDLD